LLPPKFGAVPDKLICDVPQLKVNDALSVSVVPKLMLLLDETVEDPNVIVLVLLLLELTAPDVIL
jgi:hypothetical protein